MESKEKLNYLINLLIKKLDDTDIDLTEEENDNVLNFNKDIRKDLDRLEKQDKAIEIMKEKSVNLSREILIRKTYNEYLQYMKEQKYPPHYRLSEEQYNLLKEVFG